MKNNKALKLYDHEECQTTEKKALEIRFDQALEQLYMVYRPLLSSSTKKVIAYEAILQTRFPEFSNPLHLVRVAVELNRLKKIGQAIQKAVTKTIDSIPAKKNIFVRLDRNELLMSSLCAMGGMLNIPVVGEIELMKKFPPNKAQAGAMISNKKNRIDISEYIQRLEKTICMRQGRGALVYQPRGTLR